jgi:glucose-1-phosphate cytidylyltransferase
VSSPGPSALEVLILCGGKGTRAYPLTVDLPKPMLPVADRPVLRHVMDIYASQGCTRFVLAAGYLVEVIREFAAEAPADWQVEVVDTGAETDTGERIRRSREILGETFFATYGDGLGNVDLTALLARHHAGGGHGTLTTVPLPSQYGTVDIGHDGTVRRFLEKPVLHDHWINAGFFVLTQAALDRQAPISSETCSRRSPPPGGSRRTVTAGSGGRWTPTRTWSSSRRWPSRKENRGSTHRRPSSRHRFHRVHRFPPDPPSRR